MQGHPLASTDAAGLLAAQGQQICGPRLEYMANSQHPLGD